MESWNERGTMTTKVVNLRHDKFDVYIGRGRHSHWGNPFVIGKAGDRDAVVKKYRDWFHLPKNKKLRDAAFHELQGKTLGCYCKPSACHGDIIAEYVDERWRRENATSL